VGQQSVDAAQADSTRSHHHARIRFQDRELLENACNKQGIKLKYVMELNSREAIMHAIAEGLGIGFVAEIEYTAIPGTKAIRLREAAVTIDYYMCALAVRKTARSSKACWTPAPNPRAAARNSDVRRRSSFHGRRLATSMNDATSRLSRRSARQ